MRSSSQRDRTNCWNLRFYRAKRFANCRIFTRIPDRSRAPILNMMDLNKVFAVLGLMPIWLAIDRKSTRLNSSHQIISYAVFCLKKKKNKNKKYRIKKNTKVEK